MGTIVSAYLMPALEPFWCEDYLSDFNLLETKNPSNPRFKGCKFAYLKPAEEEGFEPPDLLQSTVFKTAAIDHSAIPPCNTASRNAVANIATHFGFPNIFFGKIRSAWQSGCRIFSR